MRRRRRGIGGGIGIDRDGLVAYWSLAEKDANGTAISDISGNGNTGTSANTPVFTTDQNGVANQAMTFDGVGYYVITGDDTGYPIGNSSRTVATWAKLDSDTPSWSTVMSYGTAASDESFLWVITDDSGTGKPMMGKYGDNSTTADTAIDDSEWHHIAMVVTQDGANDVTIAFYLDGIADGTSSLANVNTILNSNFSIGGLYSGNQFLKGNLSDTAIYSSALTQDEISKLYLAGQHS